MDFDAFFGRTATSTCGTMLALLLAPALPAAADELCDFELFDVEPNILTLMTNEGGDCRLLAAPAERPGLASGVLPLPAPAEALDLHLGIDLAALEIEPGAGFTFLALTTGFDSGDPAKLGLLKLGLHHSGASPPRLDEPHLEISWPAAATTPASRVALGSESVMIELSWAKIGGEDPILGLWINGELHMPEGRVTSQAPLYLVLGLLDRSGGAQIGGQYVFSDLITSAD